MDENADGNLSKEELIKYLDIKSKKYDAEIKKYCDEYYARMAKEQEKREAEEEAERKKAEGGA